MDLFQILGINCCSRLLLLQVFFPFSEYHNSEQDCLAFLSVLSIWKGLFKWHFQWEEKQASFILYNKMNWGQAWFIVGTKSSNLALHHFLWHRLFFESWGRGFEMKSKFAMMLCLFFSDLGKTKQKPETSINVCSLCITFFGHQALITCSTKQDFSIVKLLNEGFRNFVGSARSEELAKPCPVECRPPDHPDWLLC